MCMYVRRKIESEKTRRMYIVASFVAVNALTHYGFSFPGTLYFCFFFYLCSFIRFSVFFFLQLITS